MRSTKVAMMMLGMAVLISACSQSHAASPNLRACPSASFRLPVSANAVSATAATTSGGYRRLGIGGQAVVAVGAMNSRIVLLRGVSNNEFAVSAFAHGPVPLEPVTVLGQQLSLYPSADISNVSGSSPALIPFGSGSDRVTNACSRWELRETGVGDRGFADYAEAIRPGR